MTETLTQLIAKWRRAGFAVKETDSFGRQSRADVERASAYDECANELESALAGIARQDYLQRVRTSTAVIAERVAQADLNYQPAAWIARPSPQEREKFVALLQQSGFTRAEEIASIVEEAVKQAIAAFAAPPGGAMFWMRRFIAGRWEVPAMRGR